jgi:hypothetical protein
MVHCGITPIEFSRFWQIRSSQRGCKSVGLVSVSMKRTMVSQALLQMRSRDKLNTAIFHCRVVNCKPEWCCSCIHCHRPICQVLVPVSSWNMLTSCQQKPTGKCHSDTCEQEKPNHNDCWCRAFGPLYEILKKLHCSYLGHQILSWIQ